MHPVIASDYSGMVYDMFLLLGAVALGLGVVTAVVLCAVYRKVWPLLLTPLLALGWAVVIVVAGATGALRPFR